MEILPTVNPHLNSNLLVGHAETQTIMNDGFEARNIVLGNLGTLVNGVAFVVVFRTKKIINGRKIQLLNLVLSDILCMICVSFYGLEDSTRISEGKGCLPVVFFLLLSIVNSSVMALQVSFANFIAVYKPFKYSQLITWKTTGIAAAITWLSNAGLMYWWMGPRLTPGMTCAPIVVTPVTGLLGISIIYILASLGVFTLNVATVIEVKRHVNYFTGKGDRSEQTSRQNRIQQRNDTTRPNMAIPKFGKNKVRPSEIETNCTTSPATTTIWTGPDQDGLCSNQDHVKAPSTTFPATTTIWTGPDQDGLCSNQDPVEAPSTTLPATTTIWTGPNIDGLFSNQDPVAEFISNRSVLLTVANTSFGESSTGNAVPISEKRNKNQRKTDKNSESGVQQTNLLVIRDRICKTLVILTSYSCLITLPVPIYLLCIATGTIEDPERMTVTPIGIFVSSCPITKACINPFFYVLNFVDWRGMWNKIKRRRSLTLI